MHVPGTKTIERAYHAHVLLCRPVSTVLEQILKQLESPEEEVRKGAVLRLARFGHPALKPHLDRMTSDPSEAVRMIARTAVARLERGPDAGSPAPEPVPTTVSAAPGAPAIAQLIRAIRSPDPDLRRRAALACRGRRVPELVSAMLARLELEEDVPVIVAILEALGDLRHAPLIPFLTSFLPHADGRVRCGAVHALELTGHPSTVEPVKLMAFDPDPLVRRGVALYMARHAPDAVQKNIQEMLALRLSWMTLCAVEVLESILSPWSVEILSGIASSETDPDVRAQAEKGMRMVRERLALAPEARVTDSAAPAEGGAKDPGGTGGLAATALNEDQRAVPASGPTRYTPLTDGLPGLPTLGDFADSLSSLAPRERIHALQNISQFPKDLTSLLLRSLCVAEGNAFALATLARALGQLGEAADVPMLGRLLTSPDPRVRSNAVEVLGTLPSPDAKRLILSVQDDPSPRVRASAAAALLGRGRESAGSDLARLIQEGDIGTAIAALHALRDDRTAAGLHVLEQALAHPEEGVKLQALQLLRQRAEDDFPAGELFARHARGPLLVRLRESDLENLCTAMNDTDPDVRRVTLERLKRLDHPQARARVELALGDVDEGVRARAAEILGPAAVTLEPLIVPRGTPPPRPRSRTGERGGGAVPTTRSASTPLILTAVLLVTGGLTLSVAVWNRMSVPDEAGAAAPLPPTTAAGIAEIVRARDPRLHVGRFVKWSGRIHEVSSSRDSLMIDAGGQWFAVRSRSPLEEEVGVGRQVRVEGIVLASAGSVVLLENRRLQLVAENGQEE